MTPARARPAIILITDPRYPLDHLCRTVEAVAPALGPEQLLVQLRDKTSTRETRREQASALRAVTQKVGALFVINGDVELACTISADGVHLGGERADVESARRRLGDAAFISVAAHWDEGVQYAVRARANAVLVSPIFETPGKGPPRGVEALRRARTDAGDDVLVYALGGIQPRRAAACAAAGADGVAVIRALLDVDDADHAGADAALRARVLATPFQERMAGRG